MTIRRANEEDVPRILAFWPPAGASPSPTDTAGDLQRLLRRDDAVCLVTEGGGQLTGTIIATFDGWRGHVYRLAVDPALRRRGVARRLVSEAEAWLRQAGARRVIALVELDHPWAIRFWEAVGYAHDPRMQRHARTLD